MIELVKTNPWWALYIAGAVVTVLLCCVHSAKLKRHVLGTSAVSTILTVFWPVAAVVGLGILIFIVINALPKV